MKLRKKISNIRSTINRDINFANHMITKHKSLSKDEQTEEEYLAKMFKSYVKNVEWLFKLLDILFNFIKKIYDHTKSLHKNAIKLSFKNNRNTVYEICEDIDKVEMKIDNLLEKEEEEVLLI